jgi:hypothetical protein
MGTDQDADMRALVEEIAKAVVDEPARGKRSVSGERSV